MKKRGSLVAILVGVLALVACGGPVKVHSAQRAREFGSGYSRIVPASGQNVFLIVTLREPAPEVWESIKTHGEATYFTAGAEERFHPFQSILDERSQTAPVKETHRRILLVAAVPREVLKFELHVGDFPARSFRAGEEIRSSVDPWTE